jgi:endonuclease I
MICTKYLYSLLIASLIVCLQTAVYGQLKHTIFPSLQGQPLETALADTYKPASVYLYGPARDTLFSRIYLEQDSVVCVYTQHKVYLPPNTDPTQAVYLNGIQNGINTEHSYPQSKGASESNGNPHSDMHHLYPTRLAVNEARGDLPFRDIVDAQTTKWFYRDQTLTSQPAPAAKDLYSEFNGQAFEVREGKKGNIARSIFYFFTMYRTEALTADPLFFESQRSTLCAWHYADPVDSLEYVRTFKIAKYQSNKPNPFVLDCSLAARTYCSGPLVGTCPILPTSATDDVTESAAPQAITIWPNLVREEMDVRLNLPKAGEITILLTAIDGRSQTVLYQGFAMGESSRKCVVDAPAGSYLVSVIMEGARLGQQKILITN